MTVSKKIKRWEHRHREEPLTRPPRMEGKVHKIRVKNKKKQPEPISIIN